MVLVLTLRLSLDYVFDIRIKESILLKAIILIVFVRRVSFFLSTLEDAVCRFVILCLLH